MKSTTNKNLYKSLPVIFAGAILMLVAQGVLAGQTFTVTNTNDSGTGSLRQAILDANANAGLDVVAFNISGRSRGPHTIQPTSPLPPINDPVVIDGYTQPGAAPATDDAPATLLIELDGINMMAPHWDSGLTIYTHNSTVRGLVINRFGDAGIHIEDHVGGNIIEGNYIGTDVTGTLGRGNFGVGVRVWDTPNNRIGGATPEARNVISGHESEGIAILLPDATGNQILGNYIGTDVSGTADLGNGANAVFIYEGASYNTIGPGNVISNHGYGIQLQSSSDNQIYNNNFIGNTIQAHATTGRGSNIFNLEKPIGGNYWSDWTTPDADGDGFVDYPYVFTGGVDYLPWARRDGWLPTPPPILPDIGVTDPSLVGWWKLDDGSGTVATDSSTYGNDGNFEGDPEWVSGQLGGALEFDGDDWVNVGNPHDLVITGAISIACWVNPTGFVGRQGFVGLNMGYAFKVHELGRLCFTTPRFVDHESANTILAAGTWQHVTVTFQPGRNNGAVFYLNGVETDRLTSSAMDPGSGPFLIGNNQWDEAFTGMIDDVRVYNKVLTTEEIQFIMQGEGWPFAFIPEPADGAMHLDTWVSLEWSAGAYADSHDVYFGDNFDDVNDGAEGTFQGYQTATSYTLGFPGFPYPDGLVPGTTYYWRIDEVNENEPNSPWKGNIWSFSISPNAADAPGHFEITYYDNYNYDTDQWDAWQSDATPQDAWDDKYLADGLSGNTVYTDHAFTSIGTFDLRGGLFSKDGHASGGEDWNPLQSIGDNVSGQSAHHVFAALFKGLIYLEEGDNLMVASDDDVYVFLDGNTAWGQEVLSIPFVSFFDTDSMTVTVAQAGYHMITVKYIERLNDHSGIEITVNGEHLQSAEVAHVVTVPGTTYYWRIDEVNANGTTYKGNIWSFSRGP